MSPGTWVARISTPVWRCYFRDDRAMARQPEACSRAGSLEDNDRRGKWTERRDEPRWTLQGICKADLLNDPFRGRNGLAREDIAKIASTIKTALAGHTYERCAPLLTSRRLSAQPGLARGYIRPCPTSVGRFCCRVQDPFNQCGAFSTD